MHHQPASHTALAGPRSALARRLATAGGIPAVAADILSLSATPSFVVMALLTQMLDHGPDVLCAAVTDTMPVNGMVVMYALMAGFHLPCWLRFIAGRRLGAVQPRVGSSET